MFSVDKEASIEAIRAFKEIFQAFGSTRLLGFGMLVGGVAMVALTEKATPELAMTGLYMIGGGFVILALSYILRPHDTKKNTKKEGGAQKEEGGSVGEKQ